MNIREIFRGIMEFPKKILKGFFDRFRRIAEEPLKKLTKESQE